MYSCIFHNSQAYNVKVLFYRNAFLVDVISTSKGAVLNLDSIEGAKVWKGMDVVIFDTWHWWTQTGIKQPFVEPPPPPPLLLIWFTIVVLEPYVEVDGFSILFLIK